MSAQGRSILVLSIVAAASISEGRYINFDGSSVVAPSSDDALASGAGFTRRPAALGEMVDVCAIGTTPAVIATAGLVAGTLLEPGATGLVEFSGTGFPVAVLLQTATVAGVLYEVLVK